MGIGLKPPDEAVGDGRAAGGVCAIVVTRNRREFLHRCLRALQAQTRPVEQILVVDNASSDGTTEMVASTFPDIELLELGANEGGAGGFHAGVAWAAQRAFEWLWLMDDDTLPTESALEALLAARDRLEGLPDPAILASKVVWTDGTLHPMNIPGINGRRALDLLRGADRGVVPIHAASFVSLLVRRDAVKRHGLPLKHYFIWFDDVEYTSRVLRHEAGYFVADSVVEHATRTPYATPESAGDRFYYAVRNRLFLARSPSLRTVDKIRLLRALVGDVRDYVTAPSTGVGDLRVVAMGAWDGLTTPRRLIRAER